MQLCETDCFWVNKFYKNKGVQLVQFLFHVLVFEKANVDFFIAATTMVRCFQYRYPLKAIIYTAWERVENMDHISLNNGAAKLIPNPNGVQKAAPQFHRKSYHQFVFNGHSSLLNELSIWSFDENIYK